jgi:hypothetical protein
MKDIGIWIDTQEARLIRWDGRQSSMSTLYSGISRKPKFKGETSRKTQRGLIGFDFKSKQEAKFREEMKRYLQLVVDDAREAQRLYIFGPAESKRLLEKLVLRQPEGYPMITSVENADKMTVNQLRDAVIEHFMALDGKRKAKP